MKLTGTKIYVKALEDSDAEAMLHLVTENRDFFQTYTALRPDDYYTLEGQQKRIKTNAELSEQDQLYAFGIFLNDTEELIGSISLTEVLRGPFQSCFIGYTLDRSHNGQGYMSKAVQLVVAYAFDELKLHRIEAGVMPHNGASIRVLEKAGFHKEGICKQNVKINGRWEDHQLLAIINEKDL